MNKFNKDININFNPILFSLLFTPIRLPLLDLFRNSTNLLQQSSIEFDDSLVQKEGIAIPFVITDFIYIGLLFSIFKNNFVLGQTKKNYLFLFVYLNIVLSPFFLSIADDQKFVILLYTLRFVFYSLFFIIEDEVLIKLIAILRSPKVYILPTIICIYEFFNQFIFQSLPNIVGSRLELYLPLYLLAFLSIIYFYFFLKKRRGIYLNSFLITLIITSSLSAKRALIVPFLLLFMIFLIILISKALITLKISKVRTIKFSYLIALLGILIISYVFIGKTFDQSQNFLGVSSEYALLIQFYGLDKFATFFDYSTQERIGKIILTIVQFIQTPFSLFFSSGVNSYKILYGFLPDSLFQFISEFGIFSSLIILFYSTNIKSLLKINFFKVDPYFLMASLFPLSYVVGIGLTANIFGIFYILPPLALSNTLLQINLKQR